MINILKRLLETEPYKDIGVPVSVPTTHLYNEFINRCSIYGIKSVASDEDISHWNIWRNYHHNTVILISMFEGKLYAGCQSNMFFITHHYPPIISADRLLNHIVSINIGDLL